MTTPVTPDSTSADSDERPLTMFGPDFPFAYDDYVAHADGLGEVPASALGSEVAVIGGGLAGMVAAYELAKLGLKPVVYESDRIGGRMRSIPFDGHPGVVAEMGAMRFPPSSTTLFHYLDVLGLQTEPFPNPLAEATPSTVIDLKGTSHYAQSLDDLPDVFGEVARAWQRTLEDHADLVPLQRAIRARDTGEIKTLWNELVQRFDDQTFYGFLASSEHFRSFELREVFGQVGFGTGGWDTDYPNSILEILRVVVTAADDHHRGIVGGSQQLPVGLWRASTTSDHWPDGTSVESLNNGSTSPRVVRLRRTGSEIVVGDADGGERTYPAAIVTAQSWMLLSTIECDDDLLPIDHWTAIERTHYMGSTKVFVLVDRPFWKDKDPNTGRDVVSMTLTDRMSRGTYLLDQGEGKPGLICLSYTWSDDSLKLLALGPTERMNLVLRSLEGIYPGVDFRSHIVGEPVTVSWETERDFLGAFKANLPGHYRYQERLFGHFVQDSFDERHRGLFLAGDDISWTAGWAEGAIQTALNAVWGVVHHLGGSSRATNPGPGDVFEQLAPLRLGDH
ncbi:NAD(P)/FAD-dependent oxidoreductase [Rhodococcus sp. 06-156-3C]|uniref:flavin monoamine oxidase family protein n=1 Tax=Nocardiaceae TaxID=85025 RepID=UPI000523091E|nr:MULTISPECIES: NAD(P)/FAD-dependent oxidoreductase [Rhodococcus]OZD07587.1 NAD(P)/FAD-dependent oxidoreductase [Rhodococcus sp. 06-156-4C]OZD17203.1 NAD(P)/FAD-dependent oxidoreductase [Rhodococcus sp. 06-156-3C]OZD18541.1 NAD(P)/FAD-dependent oxidoreductase [Rhodococcus sp. 06-156-4a]OZD28259.1 NAD(P)/FAD-dependent oxidoreductase [Rhodococcus sp. 06-156-3]OZD29972.1 NAD(P)/FAD-dependent oxidoreductase [Rhodococcus sp. 06-156-3b]